MAYKLVYFPKSFIELQEEIKHHPELVTILENQTSKVFEVRLAEIATYCDVILDGWYIEKQLEELCEILAAKLLTKRKGILFLN